jgi:hypothetical protein
MAKMADGGIAGYPDEEEVVGMAEGGVTRLAPGGSRGSAKDSFVASYGPLAQQVGAEIGVAPEIILSQWGIETGWGSKTVGDFNFANIKDVSGKGPRGYDKAEGSRDAYKEYASPEAFAADYASLIKRRFPEAVGAGGDVDRFTAGLKPGQQGGFATDKSYGKKIADTLTSLVPVGSAQAAPAQAAAMPTPAGAIPTGVSAPTAGLQHAGEVERGVSPTRAPAAIPQEEGFFSRLGTQLGMSEDTKRNLANLNTALGGAMGTAYIPSYLPKAQSGIASLADRIYNRISPQKGVMTAEQIASAQKMSDTLRTGEAVESARRAGQMGGATLEETKHLMDLARQTQAANRAARAAQVPSAAEAVQAASLAREAQTAARIPQAARMAQTTAAGQTALMAAPGAMAAPTPDVPPVSDAPYREEGLNNPPRKEDLSKEQKKDVIDAAKVATPKAERKGLTNDDYLVMGLTMMANPGRGRGLQGLLEAVGTGGMAAVQSRREREKAEREETKEAAYVKYLEAVGEQARRGPSELALIERIAKENNVSLTDAMKIMAGAKREPITAEALKKEWASNPFLQFKYPNVQDYIKLMGNASSGAGDEVAVPEGVKVRQVG